MAIHAKTQESLDALPRYYATDPYSLTVLDTFARELARIEELLSDTREQFFPQNADETTSSLALWEDVLGLSIAPAGVDVTTRRNRILAQLQQRSAASGLSWIAGVTRALGSSVWAHIEGPGDYQVTITLPYGSTTFTGQQVKEFARRITPAHLELLFGYDEGFILDASQLGDIL